MSTVLNMYYSKLNVTSKRLTITIDKTYNIYTHLQGFISLVKEHLNSFSERFFSFRTVFNAAEYSILIQSSENAK